MRLLLQLVAIVLFAGGVAGLAAPTPAAAQVFTEPAKPATKKPPSRAPAAVPARRRSSASETVRVTAPPPPPSFKEPDAYCIANPNASGPDPASASDIPLWLTNGWKRASNNGQSTAAFLMQWKCSSGKVLACGSTIGKDWCAKPVTSVTVTPEMGTYCADKRKGTIPRDIAGNTTGIWVCKNRKPSLSGYRSDIDIDGYLAGTWLDVTPFSPANMVGDVPRAYVANWRIPLKVGLIGSMIKSGSLTSDFNPRSFVTTFSSMQINGGQLGMVVGTNVYYGESPNGVEPSGCEAKLILSDVTASSITLTERYLSQQSSCRKPETFMLQVRDGQMLANWMVKGKTKPKRSEWVQPFQ